VEENKDFLRKSPYHAERCVVIVFRKAVAREGDILDQKYLLRHLLGDGGMGNVFLAENIKLGNKPFAIKTLKPDYVSNRELVARFLEEALAASKVEHDNIVEVFDAAIDAASGTPYIVQRYLRGTNLREHLDALPARTLNPTEALELLVPIMGALVATHKQRIVHRDIKPENIFLVKTSSGNTVPKLIDFGIARHLEPTTAHRRQTRSGSVWGTFDYMSPEQARGDVRCDERADIWSMGAVLFEALTGRLPYEVDSHATLLQHIARGAPPRIDDVQPMLPTDVSDAVARALRIDPDERWHSMAAFISALINCPCYQSTVQWRAVPLSTPDLSEVPDLSALARPATEEHPVRDPDLTNRFAPILLKNPRREPVKNDESDPGSRTLELVVPEPWNARRLVPVAAGVAAILVGILLGLRLRSQHTTPVSPPMVVAAAQSVPETVTTLPPTTPTFAPPSVVPATVHVPETVALVATVAEPTPAPPTTPRRTAHTRASTRTRTRPVAHTSVRPSPNIQTEF
jgi:serine/threonine protein kinase